MFQVSPLRGFCPPITFPSPDNGGTEGGVKTIEEPKGVERPLNLEGSPYLKPNKYEKIIIDDSSRSSHINQYDG